ncbi:metal-dependent transcriptional regulator [Algivirga pacifica]|uniref:Transcriptional regulator MntR n=1 Tax=Algivirga pacifica TaxID=1162670 RepID=A0ABP9DM30_9BACT
MDYSRTEENYLKTIYKLSNEDGLVSTNALAEELNTKPASVSDMIKKLDLKALIHYKKYRGVSLTEEGNLVALRVIRKHRLWEVFLVEKLKFNWDEVHEVAEQLEHIKSTRMIERLDEFLGFPQFDPHGDPIPDENGEFHKVHSIKLSDGEKSKRFKVVAVDDSNSSFLRYLDKAGIGIGAELEILEMIEYDGSLEILIDQQNSRLISHQVAEHILVIESLR